MNFRLTPEERLRGAIIGVPWWIRRKRLIEDLTEAAIEMQRRMRAAVPGTTLRQRMARAADDLAQINAQIEKHNRWYPIEANLPLDPITGRTMERFGMGEWKPMPLLTVEDILEEP